MWIDRQRTWSASGFLNIFCSILVILPFKPSQASSCCFPFLYRPLPLLFVFFILSYFYWSLSSNLFLIVMWCCLVISLYCFYSFIYLYLFFQLFTYLYSCYFSISLLLFLLLDLYWLFEFYIFCSALLNDSPWMRPPRVWFDCLSCKPRFIVFAWLSLYFVDCF